MGGRQQCLVRAPNRMPLPHDGQARNLERDKSALLQLARHVVQRNEGDDSKGGSIREVRSHIHRVQTSKATEPTQAGNSRSN